MRPPALILVLLLSAACDSDREPRPAGDGDGASDESPAFGADTGSEAPPQAKPSDGSASSSPDAAGHDGQLREGGASDSDGEDSGSQASGSKDGGAADGASSGADAAGASDAASAGTGVPSGKISCDRRALRCRIAEPMCAEGQVASIVGSCFGPCVDISSCSCAEAAACPFEEKYTCHRSAQHCGPYL